MDVRFFVTGHGRSGTQWLARLLNQDPTVNVHHEPVAQFDARHVAGLYDGTADVGKFFRQRKKKMERVWERHPDKGYAEVNSYLRYCVPELREEYSIDVNHKVIERLLRIWDLVILRSIHPPKPSSVQQAIADAGEYANLVAQLEEIALFQVVYTDFTELRYADGQRKASISGLSLAPRRAYDKRISSSRRSWAVQA